MIVRALGTYDSRLGSMSNIFGVFWRWADEFDEKVGELMDHVSV